MGLIKGILIVWINKLNTCEINFGGTLYGQIHYQFRSTSQWYV